MVIKKHQLLVYDLSTFVPLQRHHIGDRSLSLCNMFLDEMAKQARNLITDICTEQCTLSDQVGTHKHTQAFVLAQRLKMEKL